MENNINNAEKHLIKALTDADKKNIVIENRENIGDTVYRFKVTYTWKLNATEKNCNKDCYSYLAQLPETIFNGRIFGG